MHFSVGSKINSNSSQNAGPARKSCAANPRKPPATAAGKAGEGHLLGRDTMADLPNPFLSCPPGSLRLKTYVPHA